MDGNLTFGALVTPAGIIAAGALVTGLVEVLKQTFPGIDARVSGALLAFLSSALLYVATTLALSPLSPDGFLNVFAAWLACATTAVGIKSATAHAAKVAAQPAEDFSLNDPVDG